MSSLLRPAASTSGLCHQESSELLFKRSAGLLCLRPAGSFRRSRLVVQTTKSSRLRKAADPRAVLANEPSPAVSKTATRTGTWKWKKEDMNLSIHYEEHAAALGGGPFQNILLLPTISDVSTTEEWRSVALSLLDKNESASWRFIIVDWPGFGLSDRPRMDYTADNLESFLVDFVCAPDGPLRYSNENLPIIIGGGHAASLAIRATGKGLIKTRAMAAVAPTWAGPMPIVFGKAPEMETRYSLLRNSLQAPAIGWMMYNFMVSSPKNIKTQYVSHVYADPNNVSPSLLESRLALTKREGARYAPAAFLTGKLDPVETREEFLSLFATLEGKVPMLVLSAKKAPKRSKAEMESLNGARGVSKYVEVEGALLPQEEFPDLVADELSTFLWSNT